MLATHRNKAKTFLALGLLSCPVVIGLGVSSFPTAVVQLVNVVGIVLFVIGCCQLAIGKGYHVSVGLLGLLSIIGLIVLFCLPDKHKDGGPLLTGAEATAVGFVLIFLLVGGPILIAMKVGPGGTSKQSSVNQAEDKNTVTSNIHTASDSSIGYPADFPIPQCPNSSVAQNVSDVKAGANYTNMITLNTSEPDLNKVSKFYRNWFDKNGWNISRDLLPAGFTPRAQLIADKNNQEITIEITSGAVPPTMVTLKRRHN